MAILLTLRFTFTSSAAARSPSSRPFEVHHLISKVQGLECSQKENTVLSSEHGAEPQPQWNLEGQMINCFNQEAPEKTPGSKYSATSGLSPRGHLERQAEFHDSTQDEA